MSDIGQAITTVLIFWAIVIGFTGFGIGLLIAWIF